MLPYITEREYNVRLKEIQRDNLSKQRRNILKAEKNKYNKKFKMPSTSKIILFGVILLCLEIVIFCEYTMYKYADMSAMYVLIGIPAALIPIVWGYYSKSKAENTRGGIVYETAMQAHMRECSDNTNEENIAKG